MKNSVAYQKLESDLAPIKKILAQAAAVIQDEDVSAFPIFILHEAPVHIGINIVDKDGVNAPWSVSASTLEEFVARQLINNEKTDDFRTLYKSHHGDLCLFVIGDSGAEFIFMPK